MTQRPVLVGSVGRSNPKHPEGHSESSRKTMFFNRLRVEHEDGFCVLHFGLVSKTGLLLDYYSCVLPRQTLEQNQNPLLEYLGRIGSPKEKSPLAWQVVPSGQTPDVADIINMAFRGDMAETCFCVFSLTAATRQRRAPSGDTLEAQALALLRSSVEMQKQLIAALYEE